MKSKKQLEKFLVKINKQTFIVIALALIFVLSFISYANSIKGAFIWDDNSMIRDNELIKSPRNLDKIFTRDIGYGIKQKVGFYRPLQLVSYMADYSMWKLNPIGYHLSNITLHVLVGWAIFWLIYILFQSRIIALFSSVLFVVHPIHAEAVAYISGRADILAALFILIGMIFYLNYISSQKKYFYVFTLLSYIAAILSKESSLIFPALLVCWHMIFKKRIRLKLFIPMLLICAAYFMCRFEYLDIHRPGFAIPFLERAAGYFYLLASYLGLLVYPVNLHMERGLKSFHFSDPVTIAGVAIFLLMIFTIVKNKRPDKIIVFSLTWFILTISPILILYPLSPYIADHSLYLPSIGLFLLFTYLIVRLLKNRKMMLTALMIVLIVVFSHLTIKQNYYWMEPKIFFKKTLAYAPEGYNVYINFGKYCMEEKDMIAAEDCYVKAIRINSKEAIAYSGLGDVYLYTGKNDEAIRMLKKAIELEPDNAQLYINLGTIYAMTQNIEEAIEMTKKAIDIDPVNSGAYFNLGSIYTMMEEKQKAIDSYRKAAEITPKAATYCYLGALYKNIGNVKESKAAYKKALELDSGNEDALNEYCIQG